MAQGTAGDDYAVAALFHSHPEGITRSEAARLGGMSRTAMNQRIDRLLDLGLLTLAGADPRTGGRPADRFRLDPNRGLLLVADTGATGARVAVCNTLGEVLSEEYILFDINEGPVAVLTIVNSWFDRLLSERGASRDEVHAIGVNVVGPVDTDAGRVVNPPTMSGWHGFDIRGWFSDYFSCPVLVEKDANAMAFGEFRVAYPSVGVLVYVKLGTGISTGIVIDGRIHRGADGAAGEVGHVPLAIPSSTQAPQCRCGNVGCIEAYASGWAIIRDMRALGHEIASVNDLVRAVHDGQPDAIRLTRDASTIFATAISDIVNIVNPSLVIVGGQLSAVDDLLFAELRGAVYSSAAPLATRNLEIRPSTLNERAGVLGMATLLTDYLYSPAGLRRLLK